MVKIKRKLIRKNSEKPVASGERGGMIGGLEVDRARRLAYIEQIKRDMAVLKEDPLYHVPSRKFYENRILQYRLALGATHSPLVEASSGKSSTNRLTPKVWVRLRRKRR